VSGPRAWKNEIFQINSSLYLTRGNHTIRIGFTGNRYRDTFVEAYYPAGQHNFNGQWTAGPGSAGFAYADLVLGLPREIQAGLDIFDPNLRNSHVMPWAQDDWKVSRRLTINFGSAMNGWASRNRIATRSPTSTRPARPLRKSSRLRTPDSRGISRSRIVSGAVCWGTIITTLPLASDSLCSWIEERGARRLWCLLSTGRSLHVGRHGVESAVCAQRRRDIVTDCSLSRIITSPLRTTADSTPCRPTCKLRPVDRRHHRRRAPRSSDPTAKRIRREGQSCYYRSPANCARDYPAS